MSKNMGAVEINPAQFADLEPIQLGMDDEGNVVEPISTPTDLPAERVDYNSMTKAELLETVETLSNTTNEYENQIAAIHGNYSKQMEDMNEFYKQELNNQRSLIQYYERKFKLISDIINIEGSN